MVCAYTAHLVLPTRLATAQIENTAEIVSAPSTIGIADSGLYGETQAQIDQTLDTLQSIGVQDIRVFVPWIYVEPANGTYNWTDLDMVIQAAQARNMGVMAEVASTPLWEGSSTAITGAGTPNPADYAAFVTQVAKRYGTAISAYEIWNEPNYVLSSDPIDPVAYAALLKAAYPAIKAVDPSATVVAGALGSVVTFGSVTMDPTTFVQQMLAAGAAGYFDALSFHPYQESLPFSQGLGVANSPLSQLNAIYQMLVQYGLGNDKIWISEFGASTNDVSQQTQADLIKNLLDTWQTIAYAGPVFIYTAQDGVPGADGYGIYNADWTPKLAVAVIQQAIQEYSSGLLGTIGSTVGGVVGGVASVAQSLANLLQSIGLAIQGEFQQLGQAISAWFTAVNSALTGTLPVSTPLAATASTTAVKTAAVTTKSTTATTAAAPSTGTTGATPAAAKPASTGTTGTTAPASPTVTPTVTAAAASSTSSTPSATPVAATSPSTGGTSQSDGPKSSGGSTPATSAAATSPSSPTGTTGKSSASGTGTTDPSGAVGAQGDSSGKSGKGDGGSKGKSGKSDKTTTGTAKGSHDSHSGSAGSDH